MTALNALYVEKTSDAFHVGGRETYWTEKGDFFLFYSSNMRTWAVEKSRRFHQVLTGQSQGVAHSPKGFDVTLPAPAVEGWYEWNKETMTWVFSQGAGVGRRGRVKRMRSPHVSVRGDISGPPSEV